MGEDICKRSSWKGTHRQNIQTDHVAQYQVNKERNQKMVFKKWAEDLNRHFSQEDVQMANKHMKRCSTSLIIKRNANQNCSELSPHTSQNDHRQKKSTDDKCCRGCAEKGILLLCSRNVNMVQSLWRTVWRFPKRLKIELPYYATPGHIPQENYNSKRYMLPSVHCNTIYNSQYMEATCRRNG